jgi:membrane-associated phospholipid phosphatase
MRGFLTLLVLAWPVSAAAQGQTYDLRYDWRIDVPVTAVATTTWILSGIFESELMRKDCGWCERDGNGKSTLNGLDSSVRDGLRWSNTKAADTTSNVLDQGVMPATILGLTALASHHDDRLRDFPVDTLIILEAMILALNLNQATKMAVGRERPFVHALPADQRSQTAHPSDNNTSFYSGHTTRAFSLAVATGTVAWLRGYRWAPWIWAAGLTVATSIGYLRIAADKHYFTDVLVGAAMGSAFGFGVPYLFHNRVSQKDGQKSSRLTLALPCSNHQAMLLARYTW